jgi:hypothetical protein
LAPNNAVVLKEHGISLYRCALVLPEYRREWP